MRKAVVLLGIIVGVLLLCFWLAFYANFLANNSKVINLRISLFNLATRLVPKFSITSEIRPLKVNDNRSYLYMYMGKFQEWDFANSIIILKDLYGRVWKFRYIPNAAYEGYDKLMYDEVVIAKDKSSISTTKYLIINTKNFEENKQPFVQGDVLGIFWGDARSVSEINNVRKNGEVIEMNGAGVVSIIEYIWQ